MTKKTGRLTLPSEANFLDETKTLMERLGADALRDSDGTKLPDEIKDLDAKIYTTYFVARGYNDFAEKHPEERQHFYLMSGRVTAEGTSVAIPYMEDYFTLQVVPDFDLDPKAWWQVIDRTTGEDVDPKDWTVDSENHVLTVEAAIPYHVYTVNFLAYAHWDPTQMYNHITNNWGDEPKDIPFDVRGEKSRAFMEATLRSWLEANPKTDIVRFTTFFYHFTLVFNRHGLEKFVDWTGYSASVSPEAFREFEAVYGYKLTPEDIVDEGYYNASYRVPSRAFLDYMDLTMKFVAAQAKRLVDIVHEYGKEAVMFLGDNWIGTEPYGPYFKEIGLDGVVGSVGDGVTLRLIADIENVSFTEGRLLPYFFPDTFHPGGDPCPEAEDSWRKARRAIFRQPVDRIGYGGYLSLAYQFPEFVDTMEHVADEFRDIHEKLASEKPLTKTKVAVLNAWGKLRSWQAWIVAHAKFYKRAYSYMGVLEALAGLDADVSFISFDDVRNGIDPSIDVIINAGDAGTAWSGGDAWLDPAVVAEIRRFVYAGGGLIGVGEPSAAAANGSFFQLSDLLGVDRELGWSQSTNRYHVDAVAEHFIVADVPDRAALDFGETTHNVDAVAEHFIVADVPDRAALDFGETTHNVYATDEKTIVLEYSNDEVHLAARQCGKGRSVYIAGLPYSHVNARLLARAVLYAASKEDEVRRCFAVDSRLETAGFPNRKLLAVYNNSGETVTSTVYDSFGTAHELTLPPSGLRWIDEKEAGQ